MRRGASVGMRAAMAEILPSAAMVLVEGSIIALTILANTAMSRGMSPFVFVVYTNALGSLILLPHIFRDRSEAPVLTFPFFLRVFLLGLIGITMAQNLAFLGLSYSSPIVACGMGNQISAFSFILGIILRTTKFDWKSSGSIERVLGTLISLTGAISLTLYKGPTIRNHSSPSLQAFPAAAVVPPPPRFLVFSSPHENWLLGCLLFAASSFTLSIWNVVQVGTVKMCPQVMKIVSFYSLFGTIQSVIVAVLFLERDLSAWRLELNFELLLIIITAIFSSVIRSSVLIWCTRMKGPHFVPAFKPFGISYASTFGCLLFGDTFHYGSMMGAFICGVGYYTVLWGQIKDEDNVHKSNHDSSTDDHKVPLLQDQDSQV